MRLPGGDPSIARTSCEFAKPKSGPVYRDPVSGEVRGWRSQGGFLSQHPDQLLPKNLTVDFCTTDSPAERVDILGVFAVHTDEESAGTVGARLELWNDDALVRRLDLVNGRHYYDTTRRELLSQAVDEGIRLDTVGCAEVTGRRYRVDRLSIDLDRGTSPSWLKFRDLGTPASFVIFDVSLVTRPVHRCPFHSDSSGVALSDLSAIVRVGDRARMSQALAQLQSGISRMEDLDEARGEALTFLAVVTAAALENGGSRELHRLQLDAARRMDQLDGREDIAAVVIESIQTAVPALFHGARDHNTALIDRALAIVNKNASKSVKDSDIAHHIGMSTSHFRHLFREATGQPFHKYLLAVRLEQARALISQGASVTEAAKAAGFQGLSHFSRLFTERFSVKPSELRATSLGEPD